MWLVGIVNVDGVNQHDPPYPAFNMTKTPSQYDLKTQWFSKSSNGFETVSNHTPLFFLSNNSVMYVVYMYV